MYYDIKTRCQVIAMQTGDSTTTFGREQLCGHISPETNEHLINWSDVFCAVRVGVNNEDQLTLLQLIWQTV
jgi:hypothetical protein